MHPLDGIRVIDLTHILAGPFATHQLRMLGAEVIKVEAPGRGDAMRGLAMRPELHGLLPGFVGLNAGKRSVAVDIRTEEGCAIVHDLAATADVFVENFRPGKARRLGIDAEAIRRRNPRIVYCSISGWGQLGPYAGRGAYDHVVQAATGMMVLQGDDPTAPPVKVGFPVIDIATGMSAAFAMLAALMRRMRGDDAPIALDVSMTDAALLLMNGPVASYWLGGVAPARVGNRGFVGSPGAETFPAADGWIATAANTLVQFEAMCAVLGRPELAVDPGYLPKRPAQPTGFLSDAGTPALRTELIRAFKSGRAIDWEQKLNAVGVPAAAVRSLPEFLDGAYGDTGGIHAELPSHPLGLARPARVLHEGFRWLGELRTDADPAPRLGEHTDAVLERVGYEPPRRAELRARNIIA